MIFKNNVSLLGRNGCFSGGRGLNYMTKKSENFLPFIRITCPCNVYPLTSHFYIVKLGLQGYTIFSYFCSKN